MKCLKVAAGALNQTPLDWEGNLSRIKELLLEAERQEVQVLCLPELCITGYGCEDAFLSSDVPKRALDILREIVNTAPRMVVCLGLPVVYRNALYNCIAVIARGELMGLVAKQHLAGDGIHYEPRWFKPWPAGKQGKVFLEGFLAKCPIGDLCFDVSGIRIGLEICEDAWVAERPGSHLARKGVDLILNPSASHFSFGKQEIRKRFVLEGSRAFAATYVYANLLGNEAGRSIYDGECLIASGGHLIAQGPRFGMKPWSLTSAIVDLDLTRTQQIGTASFSPSFEEEGCWVTYFGAIKEHQIPTPFIDSHRQPMSKELEFSQAVSLALFDYLRKSRSKGFVISLSGGADSAACAYLVGVMINRAFTELGTQLFCERLGLPHASQGPGLYNDEALKRVIRHKLLTCVYQSTRNSSETTLDAARQVAEDVGASFHTLDVDSLVERYTSLVAVALQHEFSWDKDDLALQNIQARVRAPSVWMIANVQNKLLITTSNRSEAAVGYCTMDGDTAGSIAPIGGIDKTFLLQWLNHITTVEDSAHRFLSRKGLYAVLNQAPTAELRPGENQTDEQDLMPYEILKFIENRALLDRMPPRAVYLSLKANLNGDDPNDTSTKLFGYSDKYTPSKIFGYVEKFYRLWCRNQWKRERYALSFHVDDKNLDPRSWCRFPVLSGGYEVELRELKQELKL